MNDSPYRGWRFLHPDLDAPEREAGFHLSARGSIELVEGRDLVRQALLLLLSTVPGERVMRPEYGCDLHRLLFSPNDDTTAGLAIHYVRQAIERWEPRAEILELDATRNPERPQLLDIFLRYRVRATRHVEDVLFSLDLMEGEG